MAAPTENEGYIVEFITLGNTVKVTAIDPASLTEATIIGSTRASRQQLSELAIRKLHYILNKAQD